MKKLTGWKCILLALMAFAGIGLEVLLALVIEPLLYGAELGEWNVLQNVIHWTLTCIMWGIVGYFIANISKKKYGFDLLQKGSEMKTWQWILLILLVIMSLIVSYLDWNGIKVVKEFRANGVIKFIFQYIYYCFEVLLMMLILIFGQKAFEQWFHKPNIPYGGIILALTWGIGHFFTKDIETGIITTIASFAFGSLYLVVNRDIKKMYLFLWLMFIL